MYKSAAFVSMLLAAGVSAAPPMQTFKLGEPIQEDRIFACREEAAARELLDAVAADKAADKLAAEHMASGVCGVGGAVVTYTKRVMRINKAGSEWTVYEGTVGDGFRIYVLMRDWTHESAS